MTLQNNSVSHFCYGSPSTTTASTVIHHPNSITLAKFLKLEDITNQLTSDLAKIVASYLVEVFGAEEWKEYFGVIVEPLDLPEAYFAWAYSADVVEPDKSNAETHLRPILYPQRITEID